MGDHKYSEAKRKRLRRQIVEYVRANPGCKWVDIWHAIDDDGRRHKDHPLCCSRPGSSEFEMLVSDALALGQIVMTQEFGLRLSRPGDYLAMD